jgi:hypothetical protein
MIIPFGLTNAPATFQAYINETLKGLLDIIYVAYMDDICIYSSKFEKHADHMCQIFDRFCRFGLYINLNKCEFSTTKITFLDYIIGINNVEIDQTEIKIIDKWPEFKNYRKI